MANDGELLLVTADGGPVGPVTVQGVDFTFPDPSIRWVWVLDARHTPYDELPVREVLTRASNVRKKYVLLDRARYEASLPGADLVS